MAQFDVYLNPNVARREDFPYLVQLQNDQLAGFPTRLIMPLHRTRLKQGDMPRRLSQTIRVKGEELYPAAQFVAAILASMLKKPVTSVEADRVVILDALDAVISGV